MVSRLNITDLAALDRPMVEAMARKSADLMSAFRTQTFETTLTLYAYRQNIADAMWCALKLKMLDSAAHLVEAFCTYYWHGGDAERCSHALDEALLNFVDVTTGELRPELERPGLRVWHQAIRISAHWPRHHPNPSVRGGTTLKPPSGDNYATGLWFRAISQRRRAATAFLAERAKPSTNPYYSSGDLEYLAAEFSFEPHNPATWANALALAKASGQVRLPDDVIGRSSSLLAEARIRLSMATYTAAYAAEKLGGGDEELRASIEAERNHAAALLRRAERSPDAETRSQVFVLSASLLLSRGDLTSAIAYLHAGVKLMLALEDPSFWRHYWNFAVSLRDHGWFTRSREYALLAFSGAVRSNPFKATPIRQFIESLEAEHPELKSDPMV